MTKQEQIEEMAKAMEDFELQNTCDCDIELAEHLYNKGYRKVIDGERAEFEKEIVWLKKEVDYWESETKVARKDIDEAVKETAKDILQNLYSYPHEYHEERIIELAKQYSVEVEQ